MAYREVGVLWIRDVLRRWRGGAGKKAIARDLGVDPKTVRRYVGWAEAAKLPDPGAAIDDAWLDAAVAAVVALRDADRHRAHGPSWKWCEEHRERIAELLATEHYGRPLRLKTIHRRLGKPVPYSTLHRFAVAELGFGRPETTVPVADGPPGEEVQIDTGWVAALAADSRGRRRKVKAWIFTAVLSRHRFVYPVEHETTKESIEACEAAWRFFGGVFKVVIPDNTKAIVVDPDALEPTITRAFLEYSQARGFVVSPARVRRPQDKGRVERAVPTVREDCYGGTAPRDLEEVLRIGERWCRGEYGMRLHTTTRRRPLEHFESVERAALLPCPSEAYDVPTWHRPRVQRDQHARVLSALYSLPVEFVGEVLDARVDRCLVRFFDGLKLVAAHSRVDVGGRSTDKNHFAAEKLAAASRDAAFFVTQAEGHGPSVGAYAKAIFEAAPYWQSLRRVQKLLELARCYGAERVEPACSTALAADAIDVMRIARMLEQAAPTDEASRTASKPRGELIPFARFQRPASDYRLRSAEAPHGGSA